MDNKPNGGPAFCTLEHDGMTLRDYFAAKAMQGLLSADCLTKCLDGFARPLNEREISGMSYEMADAMISERNK